MISCGSIFHRHNLNLSIICFVGWVSSEDVCQYLFGMVYDVIGSMGT